MARRLLIQIEQPMSQGSHKYQVSASIGVCCYPLHGEKPGDLLDTADKLMYTAKKNGGKQIQFANLNPGTAKPKIPKAKTAYVKEPLIQQASPVA